jgi:hypothetical protein
MIPKEMTINITNEERTTAPLIILSSGRTKRRERRAKERKLTK